MITLLSATPGSGKSLLATDILLDLSRDNVTNLKHNFYYAKAFFEKLEQLKKLDYLDQILVTKGQGLERTSEIVFLTPEIGLWWANLIGNGVGITLNFILLWFLVEGVFPFSSVLWLLHYYKPLFILFKVLYCGYDYH